MNTLYIMHVIPNYLLLQTRYRNWHLNFSRILYIYKYTYIIIYTINLIFLFL